MTRHAVLRGRGFPQRKQEKLEKYRKDGKLQVNRLPHTGLQYLFIINLLYAHNQAIYKSLFYISTNKDRLVVDYAFPNIYDKEFLLLFLFHVRFYFSQENQVLYQTKHGCLKTCLKQLYTYLMYFLKHQSSLPYCSLEVTHIAPPTQL